MALEPAPPAAIVKPSRLVPAPPAQFEDGIPVTAETLGERLTSRPDVAIAQSLELFIELTPPGPCRAVMVEAARRLRPDGRE